MKTILPKGFTLFVLLGVTVYLCSSTPELDFNNSTGVKMDGNWKDHRYILTDIEPSEAERKQLPKDTTIVKKQIIPVSVKSQEEANKALIHGTIVLSGSDSRSIHRPEVCLPGQGWRILARQSQTLKVAAQDFEVMELHLEKTMTLKGGGKQVVRAFYTYWLVGNGKSTPHSWKRILYSNWDMFVHNIAHRWAYPSFMSFYILEKSAVDQENEKKTRERVYEAIRVFAPQFQISLMK